LNSVHDMGGMHGMGPIAPEADEPVFHAEWERRVHAMVVATPTRSNLDAGRHRREKIPGAEYLRTGYYEKWLASLCVGLLEAGLVTDTELATGRADPAAAKTTPRLHADAVGSALSTGGGYQRAVAAAPLFRPGDRVRARNLNPIGHTRLPRYVRGHLGVVERHNGAHVFPDSNAHGLGEDPHHLYSVRFTARELWGVDAAERDSISLDLWEPYLERA
jgi:nitrile hydratase subunit beta